MRTFSVAVVVAGLIAAVPGQAAHQRAENQGTGKDSAKPLTIIGCVAQSGALYRLDQAIIATDSDVDTQNRPSTEASPTPKMLSYALVGADLKTHVGHKVEVAGTMTSDKTSKDTVAKEIPGMKSAGTLNVKSVKMVAETCT